MVYAASSLTESFEAMGIAFEKEHPDVDVTLNFAGSQALRTQIENGAPADVFASANQNHLDALYDTNLVNKPTLFAHNSLVIVTPTDNPAKIESVADLPRAARLVVGTAEVPVGRYTLEFLARATNKLGDAYRQRVEHDIVSREVNVRLVLTKVSMGEADAGIVYRTDARARGEQVHTVEIPEELNIRAHYPIAVLTNSAHSTTAKQWVDFVGSPAGQKILAEVGFGGPTPQPSPTRRAR